DHADDRSEEAEQRRNRRHCRQRNEAALELRHLDHARVLDRLRDALRTLVVTTEALSENPAGRSLRLLGSLDRLGDSIFRDERIDLAQDPARSGALGGQVEQLPYDDDHTEDE